LPNQTTVLTSFWALSGTIFGIIMSYRVEKMLSKTGDFVFYDRVCKVILLAGILGNTILGIL
jgi:hypothetical protein